MLVIVTSLGARHTAIIRFRNGDPGELHAIVDHTILRRFGRSLSPALSTHDEEHHCAGAKKKTGVRFVSGWNGKPDDIIVVQSILDLEDTADGFQGLTINR